MAFEYIIDTGLVWDAERIPRKTTDHIQIHHTVGDYASPRRWDDLHESCKAQGDKGIHYSFGVTPKGEVYLGRGLEYCHGGVRDDLTNRANTRSISIALIGNMLDTDKPTSAQMAAAIKLVNELLAYYALPISAVLGHNEIYPYGKGQGHYTQCPGMDTSAFRAMLTVQQRDLMLTAPAMRGDDVKALQERLLTLGYDLGKWGADGIYGAATDKAQRLLCARAAQLKPGVVDAAMRSLLGL